MSNKDKRDFLIHYKGTWINGKTTTIRIPIVLKDDVNNYAICIDKGSIRYDEILEVYKYLKEVKDKLSVTNGYKSNNSSKLIKELNDLINTLNI